MCRPLQHFVYYFVVTNRILFYYCRLSSTSAVSGQPEYNRIIWPRMSKFADSWSLNKMVDHRHVSGWKDHSVFATPYFNWIVHLQYLSEFEHKVLHKNLVIWFIFKNPITDLKQYLSYLNIFFFHLHVFCFWVWTRALIWNPISANFNTMCLCVENKIKHYTACPKNSCAWRNYWFPQKLIKLANQML